MKNINRKPQTNVYFFSFAIALLVLVLTSVIVVSTSSASGEFDAPSGAPMAPGASSNPVSINESVSQTLHVNPSHSNASDSNPGTSDRPFRTIERAAYLARQANKSKTSTKVLIYPGTYREAFSFYGKSGSTTIFEAKEPGTVIVSGSDVWTNWSSQGNNTYTKDWPHNWGLSPVPGWGNDAPDVPQVLRRREIVFVNGKLLRQVTSSSQLSGDTYYVDEGSNRLTVKLNSSTNINNMTVEVGMRPMLFSLNDASNVIVRGLTFQHANSHFNDTAAWLGKSQNIVMENNLFQWNSGGGLGFGSITNIETRGNRYMNNGVTGFGGSYVINLLSENEIANYNNWRGGWAGYLGWSVAGVKHLHMRDTTYINLQTCYNQAHGLWLDTDIKNSRVDGLFTCSNASVGLYIEASQGPVTTINSILANNGREGIRGANSENVYIKNNIFYGNGTSQIYFSGENSGRSITDYQTKQTIRLDPGENWTVRDNIAIGKNNNHYIWEYTYSSGPLDVFKRSADMDNNTLFHRTKSSGFRMGGSQLDFNGYKSRIGREHNSKYQDVCFRNPDNNDFTRCDGSSPIPTPKPGATNPPVPTSQPQPTGQPGATNTPHPNGPNIARLVLIDGDSDRDLRDLKDGDIIDLKSLPSPRINVRAETNPSTVGSVKFDLNGSVRTENGAPYALYSDDNGNYTGMTPNVGDYTLKVTAFSSSYQGGSSGGTLTVRFKVVNDGSGGGTQPTPAPSATPQPSGGLNITSFTLVNADTHQDIMTLSNNGTIDIKSLPTRNLSVRANTNPGTVGSVMLKLNTYQTTENIGPYTLYGDDMNGKYYGRTWGTGDYTMYALPYSKSNQTGTQGQALTVSFKLVEGGSSTQPTNTPKPQATSVPPTATPQPSGNGPRVVNFTLINADNDNDIMTISDGAVINLNNMPTRNFNVRANTNPSAVGSVAFSINGSTRTENSAPYALYSDDAGNYHGQKLATGSYTLSGSAYTRTNRGGTAGDTLTVRFSVVEGGAGSTPPTNTPKPQPTSVPPTSVPPTSVPPTPQPASGPSVTSFTLIDADTDRDLRTIESGETINLANMPMKLNIRANTNPASVGSVRFNLNGHQSTENGAPYAVYSDNNGNYHGVGFAVGNYNLSATAYTRSNGGGVAGRTLTINFKTIYKTTEPQPTNTPKPVQPKPTVVVVQPTSVPPTFVPPTSIPPTIGVPTSVPTTVPPTNTPLPPVGSGIGLTGQYYNTPDLTGDFMLRLDAMIGFNWDMAAPLPGMPADYFSVRWTGQVEPQYSETYTFTTYADDGTRLWVNGNLVIDDWSKHWVREASGSITLNAGQRYDIRLEYYDDVDQGRVDLLWSSPSTTKQIIPMSQLYPAQVTLPPVQPTIEAPTATPEPLPTIGVPTIEAPTVEAPTVVPPTVEAPTAEPPAPIPQPGTGLSGEYFNTADLTGPSLLRADPTIAFNWDQGAPMPGMPVDFFSVRWTGRIEAQYSETYTFTTFADDGTRLWINGTLILDDWSKHWVREASGTFTMEAGQRYEIRLEYYDDDAHARVDLLWSSPSTPKQIIPSSQLIPAPVEISAPVQPIITVPEPQPTVGVPPAP